MNTPAPLAPAERFAIIMDTIAKALAAQGVRGVLRGPLLFLVHRRLLRTGALILRLAAMLQAGTLRLRPPRPLPPLPPLPPRPAQDAAPPPSAPPTPPTPAAPEKPKLPTGFGWLLRMVQAVAGGRSQLTYLLDEPDMVALIRAVPPVAHHLRPICRMLGVKPPPGLFPPRRSPRRRPKPPAPARPAARKPARPKAKTPRPPPDNFAPFAAMAPRRHRRPVNLFPLPTATGPPRKG